MRKFSRTWFQDFLIIMILHFIFLNQELPKTNCSIYLDVRVPFLNDFRTETDHIIQTENE